MGLGRGIKCHSGLWPRHLKALRILVNALPLFGFFSGQIDFLVKEESKRKIVSVESPPG